MWMSLSRCTFVKRGWCLDVGAAVGHNGEVQVTRFTQLGHKIIPLQVQFKVVK